MRYYVAVVYKQDGSSYGMSFPDLPGCFSSSPSWQGVPAAASEAIELWLEDQEDAPPSPLEEIKERPEVQNSLSRGGVLALIPYIPADTALERVNISIERGLLRSIDQVAKARGITRSGFLASAARRELTGA